MVVSDLFVGKKVWLKPNPLYVDKYPSEYYETKITRVGLSIFEIVDPIRPKNTKYHKKTLREVNQTQYKGEIVLDMEGVEEFDRKEQLIIKIRKYFNSRYVYNEDSERLKEVIEILKL